MRPWMLCLVAPLFLSNVLADNVDRLEETRELIESVSESQVLRFLDTLDT